MRIVFARPFLIATLITLAAGALAVPCGAQAPRGSARASQAPASVAEAEAGVVNIQTASTEELQRLPGIGPSKAAAIVEQRTRSPFRRVEDILRVRGIGRATFRRLRPMITVTGATTLSDAPRARPSVDDEEQPTEL